MSRLKINLVVVVFACGLAGCGTPHNALLLPGSPPPSPAADIAGSHTLFVATTRAEAADPRAGFSGARSQDVAYAEIALTVPRAHRTGNVERPRRGQKPDPARHFVATALELIPDRPAFRSALRKDIVRHGGSALVFVHGYRNSFDTAVYRMTQIVHDAEYEGTPVLFSWASAGRTADYIYDTNSASAGRDALEETLRTVVAAGATRVDIVAHSLGTWVAMEALRQLAIGGDRTLGGRLGDVVLASPDIDIDVFKSQMRRYGKPERPFFVLTSSDDRALRLSSLVAGGRSRAGDGYYADDLADLGLVVIDLSNVEAGDRLNHSRFADNPVIVQLLGARLAEDNAGQTSGDLTEAIAGLTRGVGNTLTSAAEIVVTTPFRVLSVVVGDR